MASRSTRMGLALSALAAAGCFETQPGDIAGGGGVETTEGNLASLAAAPSGARVSLIPEHFNPLRDTLPDSLTVLADANGSYRFRGLAPGRYNLEAHLPSEGTRCFRPGVVIAEGNRIIAGTDTLVAPGRLRLTWEGTRRGVLAQKGRLFRIDLTGLETDSGGITLDSLPAGLLPPFFFAVAADSTPRVWTDSIRIAPGGLDTVPVQEAAAHSAILTLDSASAFAPDSLDGYPLLVRLASPDFPFSEASAGGADLRFATLDGDPLPHAVENWDSAAGHADIWVRLKAKPGVAFDTLRMDWGGPPSVPPTGSVFGPLAGRASIWHLDEKTSGGFLEDTGPLALPTSAVNLVPESRGVIGGAQRFDGIGAYASAADVEPAPTPGRLCVSAWIMGDTVGMVGGVRAGEAPAHWTILSNWRQSDSTGFILEYLPVFDQVVLILGFGSRISHVVAVLENPPYDAWHLLGATYDGTEATLWLDGKPIKTSQAEPGDLTLPSGEYLIGASAAADSNAAKVNFFRGRIDEARVLRSVPSRAWLSRDFETQQPGSNRLQFRKLE